MQIEPRVLRERVEEVLGERHVEVADAVVRELHAGRRGRARFETSTDDLDLRLRHRQHLAAVAADARGVAERLADAPGRARCRRPRPCGAGRPRGRPSRGAAGRTGRASRTTRACGRRTACPSRPRTRPRRRCVSSIADLRLARLALEARAARLARAHRSHSDLRLRLARRLALAPRAPDLREPQLDRGAVPGEALELREPDHVEPELAQLRRLEAHEGSCASGSRRRRAARRSARCRPSAARGSGRPGSRRPPPACSGRGRPCPRSRRCFSMRLGVVDRDHQVLGRVTVRELDRTASRSFATTIAPRAGERLARDLRALERLELLARSAPARAATSAFTCVIRIAHAISSCSACESRSAATQAGVARACRRSTSTSVGPASLSIADLAEHEPLRVAARRRCPGPTILSTRGTLCGAVGERGDRLRAAHLEDAVHAGDARRHQHLGADAAVGLRRRRHHDLRHLDHRGRHRVHDHRRRVAGLAAGHVDADALRAGARGGPR